MSNENKSSIDDIVVVCGVDNNYVMPLAVLIQSISANLKKNKHVTLYVLFEKFLQRNIKDIEKVISHSDNVSIIWKKINGDCFQSARVSDTVTRATYYRILLAGALPLAVTRAIYLDCDIVAQADISELWEINLGDHLAAGVRDVNHPQMPDELEESIHDEWSKGHGYFNCGVMIADVKKWREFNVFQRALEWLAQYGKRIKWYDQDIFNVLFAGRWLSLESYWNQQTPWSENPRIDGIFRAMMRQPGMIHFSSHQKPWHYDNQHPLRSFFFYYLEQTPWRYFRPRRKIEFKSICRKIIKRLLP